MIRRSVRLSSSSSSSLSKIRTIAVQFGTLKRSVRLFGRLFWGKMCCCVGCYDFWLSIVPTRLERSVSQSFADTASACNSEWYERCDAKLNTNCCLCSPQLYIYSVFGVIGERCACIFVFRCSIRQQSLWCASCLFCYRNSVFSSGAGGSKWIFVSLKSVSLGIFINWNSNSIFDSWRNKEHRHRMLQAANQRQTLTT